MRFLVDARLAAGADTQPRLADEQRRIRELYDEGFIEQLFRRTDGTGAWLIVEGDDEESAHRQLDTLPFVEIGIMTMHLSAVEPLDIEQF
jgi:muconolactone delta-isomerase